MIDFLLELAIDKKHPKQTDPSSANDLHPEETIWLRVDNYYHLAKLRGQNVSVVSTVICLLVVIIVVVFIPHDVDFIVA